MSGLGVHIRRKAFPGAPGSADKAVLEHIGLDIASGSFVSLLGPSGCGKTTLLNIVAGLDEAYEGAITWDGGGSRPRIGYVFQRPTLLPWRTVGENLRLVMTPPQIRAGRDRDLLAAMGLEGCGGNYPKELSLGMNRRVALARALAVEPELLLMDEPFVSLDEETAEALRSLTLDIWRHSKPTVLFITHDSREALQLAQRVILLGGSPATVRHDRAIALTSQERRSGAALDALRKELAADA